MAEFVSNLLDNLAAYLAAEGIADWETSGTYGDNDTGIVLKVIPQHPDRMISLAAYPVADDPALDSDTVAIQARTRWPGNDPRPVDDLGDRVFDALHGRRDWALGSGESETFVVYCRRVSGDSLGRDANGRWERSDNYYLDVYRPATHRE